MGQVGGGRYAVYRLRGPYEGIARVYGRVFSDWLRGSDEPMADRPCMELYRNAPTDTPPGDVVTDLCVPLRERMSGYRRRVGEAGLAVMRLIDEIHLQWPF